MEEHITETTHAARGASAPTRGVTPPSTPGGLGRFVSDVIVELGFVDAATVEEAVETGRVTGKSVTSLLLEKRVLTEEQLARAIAERHGLNHLDLDEMEVDLAAANLVSRSDALRYSAVPVAFTEDGALVVAMADPADPLAIGEISVMTKLEVRPAVATPAGLESLLGRLPTVDDGRESAQLPLHVSPGSDTTDGTSDSQSSADGHGRAVVWQGKVTASSDGSRPVVAPEADPPQEPSVSVGGPASTERGELRREPSTVRRELEEGPVERGRESNEHRREMAEQGATLARQRTADAAEERDQSAELEGLRSQLQSLEGAASQLDLAQRETRALHDKLRGREEKLTRAREELDRLAAEREAAEEMATAGERAQVELERLTAELESAKKLAATAEDQLDAALEQERSERAADRKRHKREVSAMRDELERLTAELESAKKLASTAEDQLDAALEQERSERAADRKRHKREVSAMRDELERVQTAATAAQSLEAEHERLLSELEAAQARADEAGRAAQGAQRAAEEAERAAEDSARRVAHLEEADDRAERARLALADLRQEREREGELFARTERELREEVTAQREALEGQADKLLAARGALSDSVLSLCALEASLAQATGDPHDASTAAGSGTPTDRPQTAGASSDSPSPGEPPSAGRV